MHVVNVNSQYTGNIKVHYTKKNSSQACNNTNLHYPGNLRRVIYKSSFKKEVKETDNKIFMWETWKLPNQKMSNDCCLCRTKD